MPVHSCVHESHETYRSNAGFRSIAYVAPFAVFLILLGLFRAFPVAPGLEAPARVLILAAVAFLCWPREISISPSCPLASIAVGLSVFFIWIAPDLLFPGYRATPLFSNSIFGRMHSSLPPAALHSPWMLGWRTVRAVFIVSVIEELFWRAWLMRWLVNPDFRKVRLGTYAPAAFWLTAVLFASEHGPFWDVGLVAGIVYNFWMIRTRSVADCILAHAVTNGMLSGYVILGHHWQYWL